MITGSVFQKNITTSLPWEEVFVKLNAGRYDGVMKLQDTKEYTLVSLLFFGLLFFPVVQGVSTLFLQEGLITYWVSQSLMIGTVKPIVAEASPEPIPASDDTRPFAVMIDNHPDAWPQSGLNEAEYIFEVLVEGGITRLMAIFRGATAEEIGPVRSARPYFLEYAKEYDAVYAHVGGSDEALRILRSRELDLDDADQFRYGSSFWRDYSRYAPHNTYTSSEDLADLLTRREWKEKATKLPPDVRSELYPEGIPASEITLEASGASRDVVFRWNPTSESYDRILNSQPAITRSGASQSPSTVVALEIPAVPGRDPFGKGLLAIDTVGTGKATVFRNGIAIEGVWKKDAEGQTGIYLDSGKKIPFAFGQVWFLQYAPNRSGSLELAIK